MVHGTLGFVNDQNALLRSYWSNFYSVLDKDEDIYEADVGGMSSIHDRACELYQQIIGIVKTKENAEKNRKQLSEQVYGSDHVETKHR